jgi:ArsR family transcriptional regulator, arsenate/arsenite/antimonite-responsive transcriptional repressor
MSIDCVAFCKALADDTRQRILDMLMAGELCVGDIVAAFDMTQPTISHHLNILKQFGLVTCRKEGKQVFYALNRDRVVRCCGRLVAKFDGTEDCES